MLKAEGVPVPRLRDMKAYRESGSKAPRIL